MHQEIEIEFKNLLTEEEYGRLLHTFELIKADCKRQTNHYFETLDLKLKEHGSALRIRNKGTSKVLTFKQPYNDGLLETHQVLTNQEAETAIKTGNLPLGNVLTQIQKLLSTNKITFTYLGELTTDRIEKELDEGLLVFDKSYYFHVIDFELEFECTDAEIGQAFFLQLLKKNNIPKRETFNKIKRFYIEKLKSHK